MIGRYPLDYCDYKNTCGVNKNQSNLDHQLRGLKIIRHVKIFKSNSPLCDFRNGIEIAMIYHTRIYFVNYQDPLKSLLSFGTIKHGKHWISRNSGHRCASLTCSTWISCNTCITCINFVWLLPQKYLTNFVRYHWHSSISHPTWRNFQLKWYILMSATSQAFSSLLFLPSTVPSTTKPYEQKVGKWGIQEKGFYWTPKISSLVVCGLGTVEKNQIYKTHRWLPLTISELAGRLSVRGP